MTPTDTDAKFQQLLQAHNYKVPAATTAPSAGGWYDKLQKAQPAPAPSPIDTAKSALGAVRDTANAGVETMRTNINALQAGPQMDATAVKETNKTLGPAAATAEAGGQVVKAGEKGVAQLGNIVGGAASVPLSPVIAAGTAIGDKIGNAAPMKVADWLENTIKSHPAIAGNTSDIMSMLNLAFPEAMEKAAPGIDAATGKVSNAARQVKETATRGPTPEEVAAQSADAEKARKEAADAATLKKTTAWDKTATTKKSREILHENPDTTKFLAEIGADPALIREGDKQVTKDNADRLREISGQMSNDMLRPALSAASKADNAVYIKPDDAADIAVATMKQNKTIPAAAAEKIEDNIRDGMAAIERKYINKTGIGDLNLENMHDEKITHAMNGGYKPNGTMEDNNAATANRYIALAFQHLVEDNAPEGVDVTGMNDYFSKFYKAADYLDAIHDSKAPQSTASELAKRGMQGLGALAGHKVVGGLLGGVTGYVTGGIIEHAIESMLKGGHGDFLLNLEKTNPEAFAKAQAYIQKMADIKKNRTLLEQGGRSGLINQGRTIPAVDPNAKGSEYIGRDTAVGKYVPPNEAPTGEAKMPPFGEYDENYKKDSELPVIKFDKSGKSTGPEYNGFDPKASGGGPKTPITKNPQAGFVKNPFADYFNNAKGLDADQIQAKHPDIQLKRDVPAKDIHGKAVTIPKDEVLTPYIMKGDKVMLKDGQTYTVNKNQYQNIKNQSVVEGTQQDFAPEMKGLEVKTYGGGVTVADIIAYSEKHGVSQLEATQKLGKAGEGNQTRHGSHMLPGGTDYEETLIKAPEAKADKTKIKADLVAANSAFKEHSVNMKKKYPSEKGPFVEMSHGEFDKHVELMENVTRIEREMAKEERGFTTSHFPEDKNIIASLHTKERVTPDGKKVTFAEEAQSDWMRAVRAQQDIHPELRNPDAAVPTHPLLDKHVELSVKALLQKAVAKGSDYVAWINGEQAAARYNLANHVNDIGWIMSDGERVVNIDTKQQGNIRVRVNADGKITTGTPSLVHKPLADVIGKDTAAKIMEKPDGTLTGEGLSIGGEWAKNLYDKQWKSTMERLTGAKVETLDMGLPISRGENQFQIHHQGYIKGPTYENLSPENMKVGQVLYKSGLSSNMVLTEILGNRKFKAVPIHQVAQMRFPAAKSGDVLLRGDKGWLEEVSKNAKTFDLGGSNGQQAIRLTPDIVAKIKGLPVSIKRK